MIAPSSPNLTQAIAKREASARAAGSGRAPVRARASSTVARITFAPTAACSRSGAAVAASAGNDTSTPAHAPVKRWRAVLAAGADPLWNRAKPETKSASASTASGMSAGESRAFAPRWATRPAVPRSPASATAIPSEKPGSALQCQRGRKALDQRSRLVVGGRGGGVVAVKGDHRLTGVDRCARGEVERVLLVQLVDAFEDTQAGADGALGIVAVGDRRPEDRHDRVADFSKCRRGARSSASPPSDRAAAPREHPRGRPVRI